ncbi:MAG: T9SS type A sorting domain-containing protein [Bacteroidetes bacterium]|nr:T9SS type A sorting domain-containing protein [Bacteroidota bacterium]
MKRILLFVFLTLIATTSAFAQVINWQTAAGSPDQSWPSELAVTPDSGFIVAVRLSGAEGFEVTEPSYGATDYWVVKYNANKKIQWQKRYGGGAADDPRKIRVAKNGGYFVSGTSYSVVGGNKTESSNFNDPWLLKLDANGNIIWQNTIRGPIQDYLNCMDTTSDNGVIMVIGTNSPIGLEKTVPLFGQYDAWLVKLDSTGMIQWQNVVTIPGASEIHIYDIIQVPDGGYAAVGTHKINNYISCLFRLDSLGNVLWHQNIYSTGMDQHRIILNTSDNGFLIASSSGGDVSPWKTENSIGLGANDDIWVVKVDSLGTYVWDNTIGGIYSDEPIDMCLSTTGEIFIAGTSVSKIGFDKSEMCRGTSDAWIVKLSANGIKLWDKTFGADHIDHGVGIGLLPNSDLLVVASSYSEKGFDRAIFRRSYSDSWLFTLTENFNEITGNVFTDMNSNSMKDSGDFVPQNLKIQTTDSNYHSYVSYDGTYKMLVLDSTYNFLTESNPYYGVNPALNTANFTGFKQTDSLNDYILHPNVFIQDLKISLAPPAIVRPGFSATYMISCENKGTVLVPAQIYFRLYPNISYVSSTSIPILLTSDSVLWDIGVIVPGQSKIMSVTVKLDTSIQVGSILNSYARALPIVTDFAPSDNNATWESIVRGSYDPNDILVDKRTIEYNTLPSNPVLRYTIRFQNTGNAPATIVSVINNLPSKLLDSSFEFEASSHPVNIEYTKNSRMLKFDFPGIVLPDSGTNHEQSMGFVQYSIRPLTNLLPGETIRNKAFIYFDYNSPVITNNAVTAIVQTTAINEWVANGKLNMHPNPAKDVLNISLPESVLHGMLMVYDLQGRLIWNEKVNPTNELYKMSMNAIDPGMYTILYVSGNNRYSSRFVKL